MKDYFLLLSTSYSPIIINIYTCTNNNIQINFVTNLRFRNPELQGVRLILFLY